MTDIRFRLFAAVFAALPLLAAGSAEAQLTKAEDLPYGEITGSLGLGTDYVFRGISQTTERPAVQGSLEYGFQIDSVKPYVGTFLSNVRFPDGAGGTVNGQNLEVDIYGGLRGTAFTSVTWDVGLIRYFYPGTTRNLVGDPNWNEVYLKLGYDAGFAAFMGSVFYSPGFGYDSDQATYVEGGIDVPLPFEFTASGRIGHQWIDRENNFGLPDYLTWSGGLSRDLFGLTLALTYVDTNIKRGEALSGGGAVAPDFADVADQRVIFSITKKF